VGDSLRCLRGAAHNALWPLLPELLLHYAEVLLNQLGLQVVGPHRLQQLVQPLRRLGGGGNLPSHRFDSNVSTEADLKLGIYLYYLSKHLFTQFILESVYTTHLIICVYLLSKSLSVKGENFLVACTDLLLAPA
jgi:hypothetical protein